MVIDAAKGIEARTRKLFEICRLRDIPIVTFVNKMDRESREPLELLDEIEKALALDTAPMVWPIGKGRDFRGTYDLAQPRVRRLDEDPDGHAGLRARTIPRSSRRCSSDDVARLARGDRARATMPAARFDLEAFLRRRS